jgi:hypothetical protein
MDARRADAPLSRPAIHRADGADARHAVAGLLVALGLGQLDENWEAHDDLTAQLERPVDELQGVELDVADAVRHGSKRGQRLKTT